MTSSRVFLIGGAPGVGKTTLGCALAARIGGSSITIDDIMTVAKTATTIESHPGLYLFQGMTFVDYFTYSSVEQMQADADRQHEAVWSFVEKLITRHFNWTTRPIVIDGWHLRPKRVDTLDRELVDANWICIDPDVLRRREEKNTEFLNSSPDPEQMLENFLARSLWYNDLTRQEAARHEMTILEQNGDTSPEQMCDVILGN